MNKSIFRLTFIFLAGLLLFNSCKKDDENDTDYNRLENITYPIDENSSFNMTNFINSYEQIFCFSSSYKSSISNDIEAGKAIYSYQNFDGFGDFGKKISTFTHIYNEDGIITSSIRQGADESWQGYNMTIDYDYDLNGFITKMIQKQTVVHVSGESKLKIDTLKFEYNENNKITKETRILNNISNDKVDDNSLRKNERINSISRHNPFEIEKNTQIVETTLIYEYNNINQVISVESRYFKLEFIYSDYDLVLINEYSSGTLYAYTKYIYDNKKRYTSIEYFDEYDSDSWEKLSQYQYSYSSNSVKRKKYWNDFLEHERTYTNRMHLSKDVSYFYEQSENFYAISVDYDSNCRPTTKYYLDRDDNLEYNIVAYNTIDSRSPDFGYSKSHESAYDNNGNLLCYAESGFESNPFGGSYWESKYFYPNGDLMPWGLDDVSHNFPYSVVLFINYNYRKDYCFFAGDISE